MRRLFGIVLAIGLVSSALAQEISYKNLLKPLLETSRTVTGEALAYPTGTPKVNVSIVVVPPGGATGWHSHPVPLVAYMLEGELTVDYGDKGKRTYRKGEALVEAMATPHNGTNTGSEPVQILAVYLGADGLANAAPAEAPKDK